MNQTRTFLILALLVVAYLLFNQWMGDYHSPQPQPETAASTAAEGSSVAPRELAHTGTAAVPEAMASATSSAGTASMPVAGKANQPATKKGHFITVTTDVLKLKIDTRGGTLVSANLLDYAREKDSDKTVRLLDNTPDGFYRAESGLVGLDDHAAPDHTTPFKAEKDQYSLDTDQDQLTVTLTWHGDNGVSVDKVYTLERGSYTINLTQKVKNNGDADWQGQAYRQLERVKRPEEHGGYFSKISDSRSYAFYGAAWYGPDKKFNKIEFDKIAEKPLASGNGRGRQVTNGWIAMEQAYFVGAWLPPQGEEDTFATASIDRGDQAHYFIRARGPVFTVAPGDSASSQARLFLGPKIPDLLKGVSSSFDLALNYGVMTIVARPLHWILSKLHAVTGNWGWAIVLLVLLINAAIYKLNAMQYRSAAHMRRLKPRMDDLKQRYGDDKQKLQQATMELYKKEKVNPAAGCFPILITLPIFFGLYELLRQSVELRHAPFFGWIHDLSAPDPFYILPILYGGVMLAQSLAQPMSPGMSGTQQKMMRFMPVAMTVIFLFFPAGLALYYIVNGLCRLATQWWVYRQVHKHEAQKKAAKS